MTAFNGYSEESVVAACVKDTANHQVHIVRNDGVYRHIRVAQPETSNRHFDIVTFPGYLVYAGDMGSFVFRRIHDMLEFFHHSNVNVRYWGEKVEAACTDDGLKGFSSDAFREFLCDHVDEKYKEQLEDDAEEAGDEDDDPLADVVDAMDKMMADGDEESYSKDDKLTEDIVARIKADINKTSCDDCTEARDLADQIQEDYPMINFGDPCDWPSSRRFSYRFIWACEAIRRTACRYYETRKQEPGDVELFPLHT